MTKKRTRKAKGFSLSHLFPSRSKKVKKPQRVAKPAKAKRPAQGKGLFSFNWFQLSKLKGEHVQFQTEVGFGSMLNFYKVMLTNKRFIAIRAFPKNLFETDYRSIEFIEYYTNVEWLRALFSGIFVALAFLFVASRDAIMKELYNMIAPLKPLLSSGNVFGMDFGALIIFLLLVAVALYFGGIFGRSLFGRLRVLVEDQAPLDMIATFTPDIQKLIRTIEARKIRRKR
jgi:hypothetical protein